MMHVEKELESALTLILNKLDTLQDDVSEVKQRTTKIEFTIETDIKPRVQLLAEGFQGYAERVPLMDRMAEDLETVKEDVSIIKDVVTSHSRELQDHDRVIKQLKAIQ